ncbi:MAG: ABC transporter ATP-binding protein [Nanoarchaeota archaeon]
METILEARNIHRYFKVKNNLLKILVDVNLKVKKGEFLGIYGPSGSGKSTLLYILSLIDKPTKGEIIYNINFDYKKDPYGFRLNYLGFVFQQYKLINELTVLENIILPNILIMDEKKLRKKAKELLKFLDIYYLKDLFPNELSGGQQQRVSIARALVKDPIILFADEPTANLDVKNGLKIMEMFQKINKELGTTIICVSHEESHRKFFSRIVEMEKINKALKN